MGSIYMQNPKLHSQFSFGRMGNLSAGRPTLGENCPVLVYRLMHNTLLETLEKKMTPAKARSLLYSAGQLGGGEMAMHRLTLEESPSQFFLHLADLFAQLGIGILDVPHFEPGTGEMVITVQNGLVSSGLPRSKKPVCHYVAGLLAGIMQAYTGRPYSVRETSCCADNGGTCRFEGTPNL